MAPKKNLSPDTGPGDKVETFDGTVATVASDRYQVNGRDAFDVYYSENPSEGERVYSAYADTFRPHGQYDFGFTAEDFEGADSFPGDVLHIIKHSLVFEEGRVLKITGETTAEGFVVIDSDKATRALPATGSYRVVASS